MLMMGPVWRGARACAALTISCHDVRSEGEEGLHVGELPRAHRVHEGGPAIRQRLLLEHAGVRRVAERLEHRLKALAGRLGRVEGAAGGEVDATRWQLLLLGDEGCPSHPTVRQLGVELDVC